MCSLLLLVSQQAMIIAFTSDMIPRLVYYWSFSVYPYRDNRNHTMAGYIETSLSVFQISDFSNYSRPLSTPYNITTCRYRDLFHFPVESFKDGQFHKFCLSSETFTIFSPGIEISGILPGTRGSMSSLSTTGM